MENSLCTLAAYPAGGCAAISKGGLRDDPFGSVKPRVLEYIEFDPSEGGLGAVRAH